MALFSDYEQLGGSQSKKRWWLVLGGAVVGVALILAIAIPLATRNRGGNSSVGVASAGVAGEAAQQSGWFPPWRPKTPAERAHEVLSRVPLIDGHNDLAWQFRRREQNHIRNVDLRQNLTQRWPGSHTDISRLRQGQVGGQFWSCYVGCNSQYTDAVRISLDQLDTIQRFIAQYSDTFQFVDSAQGIWDAFNNGKIASLIGLEGGHSIDSSMATLRTFYSLGVRYLTLTHTCNTPWADSSPEDEIPGPGEHGGVTEWGKKLIHEMNHMGMMVDISHVSKATMLDALDVSVAPIIFSHSSAWELCHHHRNVQDDVLRRVTDNGGVVMVNFFSGYINCPPREQPVATLSQIADHVEHIKDVAGADHVGIGGDYDGVNSMPVGMEDVSKYPALFEELASRGWSESDLEKLAGRNIIRVFGEVEKVRDRLSRTEKSSDDLIPKAEIPNTGCRPDF